jgi:HemY protein
MFRILSFIIVVFALGLGFAWLADRPGDMVITFNGYQYEVTLMVAAVAVVAVVAAAMILWWLLKSIWMSPYLVTRYFRVRRRDRGYQALSTGMLAAGAGDAATAKRMNKQAAKLISADQEPLLHLLEVQTLLLEGDHEKARGKFETMLDDPELRPLGLHGLYLEAQRLGHKDVARHYAIEASRDAPQLIWAANAALEDKAEAGEWDEALKLLDRQRASGQIAKGDADRRRAVLLTAKANEMLDRDGLAAKNAALEANRLAPDLVPAAVTAARSLFRQNDLRRGSKILEAAWKKEPHPEIAEAYVNARSGDSTQDRLARAQKLKKLRTNNADSALAVARAALDAGEFKLAREETESAIRLRASEGAYLLRADIEEAETGDQGRVRHWLQRAMRAPRDPAWSADGAVSDRWLPLSPVTGRLDAFEWRQPVERAGQLIESEETPEPSPTERALAPVTADGNVEDMAGQANKMNGSLQAEVPDNPPPADTTSAEMVAANGRSASEESGKPGSDGPVLIAPAAEEEAARRHDIALEHTPPKPPTPDDPGVEEVEGGSDQSRRFRLF